MFFRVRLDASNSTFTFHNFPNVKLYAIELELTAPCGRTRGFICNLAPADDTTAQRLHAVVLYQLKLMGCPNWLNSGVKGCLLMWGFCTDAGTECIGFLKIVHSQRALRVVLLATWCFQHQINLVERELLTGAANKKTKAGVPGVVRSIRISYNVYF